MTPDAKGTTSRHEVQRNPGRAPDSRPGGSDEPSPRNNYDPRMDSASLSRAFFDAFRRRDLDTMFSMMAEDVRYEMPGSPVLTTRDSVRDMYVALLAAIGDAEMRVLECIAEGNKTALILSLPGSDEVGGSIFHEWSDDGLLLRYQAFTRMPGPPPTPEA